MPSPLKKLLSFIESSGTCRRQRARRKRRLPGRRIRHPVLQVLVTENRAALARHPQAAGDIAASERPTRARELRLPPMWSGAMLVATM
jgi:hypothetical protein